MTPLIYVRASDFDGDHAIQPVTVGIQDDKPVFCKVDWGCDNDSKHGVGLIDEDKLDPNGNHDWAPGDDKGGTHVDGEIIFNFGADKPGTLTVGGLTVKDCADPANVILQVTIDALGNPVVTSGELPHRGRPADRNRGVRSDVNGIVTWQGIVAGSDPAQEAFKLTMTPPATISATSTSASACRSSIRTRTPTPRMTDRRRVSRTT